MPPVDKFTDYKARSGEAFRIVNDRGRKLVSLVLWSIWFTRNKTIHEGLRHNVNDIIWVLS